MNIHMYGGYICIYIYGKGNPQGPLPAMQLRPLIFVVYMGFDTTVAGVPTHHAK